jgi:hypothetical protein
LFLLRIALSTLLPAALPYFRPRLRPVDFLFAGILPPSLKMFALFIEKPASAKELRVEGAGHPTEEA